MGWENLLDYKCASLFTQANFAKDLINDKNFQNSSSKSQLAESLVIIQRTCHQKYNQ